MPELRRYSRDARRALWRVGLLRGVWVDRLAEADEELVRFVNRFYRVPGFQLVVRDYFGGRLRRAMARMATRLAQRLAEQHRGYGAQMRFERTAIPLPQGMTMLSTALVMRRRRYLFLPWRQLTSGLAARQLQQSASMYGKPDAVRWVFDSTRLGRTKGEIVDELRRAARRGRRGQARDIVRPWLDALNRVVTTV